MLCDTRTIIHFLIAFAIVIELLNGRCAGENEKAEYLVDSPSCRIPDYDPYDKSIDGIPSKLPPFQCTSLPLLTTVSGIYNRRDQKKQEHFSHVLHLHKHHFHYYNITQDKFICCYKLITRDDSNPTWPDGGYKLSECTNFTEHVRFHEGQEFIWVQCEEQRAENRNSPKSAPYVNMHAFIGYKEKASRKIQTQNLNNKNKDLSVMIIGFDAMSRLNLIRTMPKTVEYLTENGWYDLKGFNKVGDNTFPNLMAAFTGMNLHQVTASCLPSQYTPLDDCPIIWKKFSDRGYITAYGEDQPSISTFNYIKSGFKTTPTDYYMRPFILAAHTNTQLKEIEPTTNQPRIACYGPTKVADHFFNYSLDFSRSFSRFATFSLFWQNGFSHDSLNGPSSMDDMVLAYFKKLAKSGVLQRTMILFMSDHGFRFGSIRQTFLGYLEERLPFLYFWVPERFKKLHPNKIRNLEINSNRLTSPYDVYMTLVDILGEKVRAPGCPKCMSLFKSVPWNRSCADAGILDHWCTCAEYSDIDATSPLAAKMADLVVKAINKLVLGYKKIIKMNTTCAQLRLNRVVSVRKKISSIALDIPHMIIVVETYPGFGRFEGTVTYLGSWKVLGDISRINRYDNQSICANHNVLRKYCFCL